MHKKVLAWVFALLRVLRSSGFATAERESTSVRLLTRMLLGISVHPSTAV